MLRHVLVVLFLVLSCSVVNGAEDLLVVGAFYGQPVPGVLPDHWEPLEFDGIDRQTIYTHIFEDSKGVIQATSSQSSSGLVRHIEIDPAIYSTISFRWKIQDIIESADLTRKKGDDAPARVYITFGYDSTQVNWWEKVKFAAIKLFYGEYPPIGALTYVWGSHVEQGAVFSSPYTSRVKVIVLESGLDKKGQWLSEQRHISDDYRLAFGTEEVPHISGVAIMTDTDNTGEQAMAWYGDIIFSK